MRYLYATNCQRCEGGCRGPYTQKCPSSAYWGEYNPKHPYWTGLSEGWLREVAERMAGSLSEAMVLAADGEERSFAIVHPILRGLYKRKN